MKFAKLFQEVLTSEHLPEEWLSKAIKYKQLKKRINKVVNELESIGVSKDDMIFTYNIELVRTEIRPKLKMNISPLLKSVITEKLDILGYEYFINVIKVKEVDDNCSTVESAVNPFDEKPYYELTISLIEDSKFFQILYEEIEGLNEFKELKEKEITDNVQQIASNVSTVTSPALKKSDLYVWRQIFQMYIESEIFFSTIEKNAGDVNVNLSKERYTKFLQQIAQTNIISNFKHKDSAKAFYDFKLMNDEILKVSNYQIFNTMAVTKILKKFDKQTHLTSKNIFPNLVVNAAEINILKGSIAKDICYIISNQLLSIVPQIDDYLCPICCAVAFKPIRLSCNHLFCVRCLVKLRRNQEDKCPLCREPCLLSLTANDLDISQMNYLRLYFPKEVKEKEKENDREIISEQYGRSANDKQCIIM
ncbi:hypothetical protein DAMA08_005650 [Martiniozyma asiatica (nom. inval.)]|nr:hypothetical protein DAMA08_005650 [Martiniozyma asiatica]